MVITSPGNEQVKRIHRLQTSSRVRREEGLFVAEGIRFVQEVEKEDLAGVYCAEGFAARHEDEKKELPIAPILVSDAVMKKMSDTQSPQGILALVRNRTYELDELFSSEGSLLFLENLQNPGNLGTLIRTAEGAGFQGIVLSEDSVDCYNPKVVRGSMGSLLRMPIIYVMDFSSVIRAGQEKGYLFYAAELSGSERYDRIEYPKKTALVIGNEGNGLSKHVTKICNKKIRIPMAGRVESLNAAVAASVLMYEVYRQEIVKAEG